MHLFVSISHLGYVMSNFLMAAILLNLDLLCHFLSGLAVAADKNFKTFEAAYPYVVQKLLTDNSAAIRRILHSVMLKNFTLC